MVHESFRGAHSGRTLCASLSTLPRFRLTQYQGVRLDTLTTYNEGWSRLLFLDHVQHYFLVTPFTDTVLVVSISTLSFLSSFILIVLLVVLFVIRGLES